MMPLDEAKIELGVSPEQMNLKHQDTGSLTKVAPVPRELLEGVRPKPECAALPDNRRYSIRTSGLTNQAIRVETSFTRCGFS